MSHTHHYSFWHAHEHSHIDESKGVEGWEPEISEYYRFQHPTGHYHNWMQTHDHDGGGRNPHTHKAKQYHPTDDKVTKHHHALDAHDIEKEEKQDVSASRD